MRRLHRQAAVKHDDQPENPSMSSALQDGLIFSQLTSYMEEARESTQVSVFKLADLVKMYQDRQQDFGITTKVNSTRLKQRLLSHFMDLEARTQGRDILLAFSKELSEQLKSVYEYDEDAICLAKAAKLIRRDFACFVHKGTIASTAALVQVQTHIFMAIKQFYRLPL